MYLVVVTIQQTLAAIDKIAAFFYRDGQGFMEIDRMEKNCEHLEYLKTILDSVADGVFTVDVEMRITTFNRAAEEIIKR